MEKLSRYNIESSIEFWKNQLILDKLHFFLDYKTQYVDRNDVWRAPTPLLIGWAGNLIFLRFIKLCKKTSQDIMITILEQYYNLCAIFTKTGHSVHIFLFFNSFFSIVCDL